MIFGIADICMFENIKVGRLTRGEFIRKAAQLGAQSVSIILPGEKEGREFRAIADDLGVELEFRTSTTDAEQLSDRIERAHDLGASFLRTMLKGRYFYKDPEKQAQMLQAAAQGLQAVVPLLNDLGLTVGVENHADVTSRELISLIETVDSERVKVLLDFGNSAVVFEHPQDTIEMLSPYAAALHVKDIDMGRRNDVFCLLGKPLGEGIIDFDHVMQQLLANCPDVRFVLEGRHPPIPDLEESLKEEIEMLEKSVAFAKRLLEKYCS